MRHGITVALAVLPSSLTQVVCHAGPARPETAQMILQRSAHAYKSCRSYRDNGTVTTRFGQGRKGANGPSHTTVLHFKTAYERPNLFRFEYIQNQSFPPMNDRYVIWSDGKSARSWWTITPEVREAESLGLAVAGATGVSHGSAHTVSRLLMPREIGGWALTEMTGTKLLKDDKIGNEACARVRGRNVVGEPVTVWISRRTNMILKIVEVGEGLGTLSTTVYKPELNATIPEGTFIFTPPSK